jgi:membrane-associated protein
MHTVQFLNLLVANHEVWAYFVIFLGLIFEGEVVVIFAGVLSNLGALSYSMTLVFILAGILTKIFVLYYLGGVLCERYNHRSFFQYIEKRISSVMPRFEQRPFWSIFASTFIMGIGWFVMLFAGYKKINYRTYLKAQISSVLIWAPLLLTLGYFFGQAALSVTRELWKFSLVIILLIIGFILFDKIVAWIYAIFHQVSNFANGKNNDKRS